MVRKLSGDDDHASAAGCPARSSPKPLKAIDVPTQSEPDRFEFCLNTPFVELSQDQMFAAQSDESWRCDHSRSEWSWYDAQAAFGPMIGPTLRPVTVILLLNSWLGCNPLNSITSPFARLCE